MELSAQSVADAGRIFRGTVKGLAEEEWPKTRAADLRRFAIEILERHLERRLMSGAGVAVGRGSVISGKSMGLVGWFGRGGLRRGVG